MQTVAEKKIDINQTIKRLQELNANKQYLSMEYKALKESLWSRVRSLFLMASSTGTLLRVCDLIKPNYLDFHTIPAVVIFSIAALLSGRELVVWLDEYKQLIEVKACYEDASTQFNSLFELVNMGQEDLIAQLVAAQDQENNLITTEKNSTSDKIEKESFVGNRENNNDR